MSIADKLKTIDGNLPKVYKSGYAAGEEIGWWDGYDTGYDEGYEEGEFQGNSEAYNTGYNEGIYQEQQRFWDAYQNSGKSTYCDRFFASSGWNNNTFKPKYDIKPVSAYGMFWGSRIEGDLVEILNEQEVTLDFSGITSATNTVYLFGDTRFTRIGVVDVSNVKNSSGKTTSFGQLFWNSSQLITIDKVIVNGHGFSENSFLGCSSLVNLTIEGTIGLSSHFSGASNLSHDSLMSIINALADYSEETSGTTYTLTLGTTNLSKLSDEEKAIIENKGWEVK